MTAASDQDVIKEILQGNKSAYSVLVDRYKDMVFTLSLRMMKNKENAEEVAQDAFVKMFKSLVHFKGNSKFSTWLYKITYNTCLDKIKGNKNKIQTETINEVIENKLCKDNDALNALEEKEKKNFVQSCLALLPPEDSFILTLFYLEEQSIEETANILGIKPNNVKIKLYRSRKKLAALLQTDMVSEITQRDEKTYRPAFE